MPFETITHSDVMETCLSFLQEIGIPTRLARITGGSFLPGLLIDGGVIVIDEESLLYPGDILHEAGHIAVVPAAERPSLNSDQPIAQRVNRASEEMMAIAWSYAACIYLKLDPALVFHEYGYQGGGAGLVENFSQGRYFGTPMLQWCGMTKEPGKGAAAADSYPNMIKWLRD